MLTASVSCVETGTRRDASCPLPWTSRRGGRGPFWTGYMGWFPSSLSRGARAPLDRGEGSSIGRDCRWVYAGPNTNAGG